MAAHEGITDLTDSSSFDDDQRTIWDEQKAIYAAFLRGDASRVDRRISSDATIWDWETVRIAKGHDAFNQIRAARPTGVDVPKAVAMTTEDPIISIFGELALARHLVTVLYNASDGSSLAKTLRCTLMWQKRAGEWWIVHSHEDVIRTEERGGAA